MAATLEFISVQEINSEVRETLTTTIANVVEENRNDIRAINTLVFIALDVVLLEGSSYDKALKSTLWQQFAKNLAEDNENVLNQLKTDKTNFKFAAQFLLEVLSAEELLQFDVATAAINRLNIMQGESKCEYSNLLIKYFKTVRSELVRSENMSGQAKRNEAVLNWVNSVEYQVFNGIDYSDLDDAAKIVCLAKDFCDITKGEYSTSDLLAIKTAMINIGMNPKEKIKYVDVLNNIFGDVNLKKMVINDNIILPIEYLQSVTIISFLNKLNMLHSDEAYIVDTITELLNSNNVPVNKLKIINDLINKYMLNELYVNLDFEIEKFDLIIDLIYNMNQVSVQE